MIFRGCVSVIQGNTNAASIRIHSKCWYSICDLFAAMSHWARNNLDDPSVPSNICGSTYYLQQQAIIIIIIIIIIAGSQILPIRFTSEVKLIFFPNMEHHWNTRPFDGWGFPRRQRKLRPLNTIRATPWMYPDPKVPLWENPRYALYSGYLWVYTPQESLENMGTLLGVHPIVDWVYPSRELNT